MTPEERHEYIDQKLAAVAESLELLTHDVHALQENQRAAEERLKRQEDREERLRAALLAGVAAFLRELGGSNGKA